MKEQNNTTTNKDLIVWLYVLQFPSRGGGDTAIYGLYRYVPL